jgi:hypothetical protein
MRVWRARTLSPEGDWKYVNVRRLLLFLEHSIHEGTQWAAFEPNDERLRPRIAGSVRGFPSGPWRQGALAGRTEQEAFFVTCDRTTMTQNDIVNGRLVCQVGVAPVRPAEFVMFRLVQRTAGGWSWCAAAADCGPEAARRPRQLPLPDRQARNARPMEVERIRRLRSAAHRTCGLMPEPARDTVNVSAKGALKILAPKKRPHSSMRQINRCNRIRARSPT